MNGKTFFWKYFNSEIAGFGFGLPVAAAYALLLVNIDPKVIGSIVSFILVIAFILVAFIAFPYNFYAGRKYGKKIDLLINKQFDTREATEFFTSLMNLPFHHARGIFLRISCGSLVTGFYMLLILNVPVLQVIIAVLLAFYGAYLAGVIAYIIVINIVRPFAQLMVINNYINEEHITKKKYFSFNVIQKFVLFLIIPIVFTNVSIFLTVFSSNLQNASYSILLAKITGVVMVNIICLSIAVFFTIAMINQPLKNLQKSLGVFAYSSGNLTETITTDLSDDFSYISYLMNRAISSFRDIVKKVRESGQMLKESTQELSVSTQEISATSNEQASSVKEIVSTMEDSDRLAKLIADHINEVTNIAMNSKKAVEDGFNIIKDSLIQMEEIKSSNHESIEGMQFLNEKIESIWEIVKIINGIASQTKIIAFNAELEASAAGEAGKNFQIVAMEIRRLADNTVSSTNDIKTKINEIQKSSDQLIEKSKDGTEKIESGYNLSKKIEELFANILDCSETTFKSASDIETSIRQQVDAFEQILKALKQISEGINNFVLSTKLTSKFSVTLNTMADSFNDIVKNFTT